MSNTDTDNTMHGPARAQQARPIASNPLMMLSGKQSGNKVMVSPFDQFETRKNIRTKAVLLTDNRQTELSHRANRHFQPIQLNSEYPMGPVGDYLLNRMTGRGDYVTNIAQYRAKQDDAYREYITTADEERIYDESMRNQRRIDDIIVRTNEMMINTADPTRNRSTVRDETVFNWRERPLDPKIINSVAERYLTATEYMKDKTMDLHRIEATPTDNKANVKRATTTTPSLWERFKNAVSDKVKKVVGTREYFDTINRPMKTGAYYTHNRADPVVRTPTKVGKRLYGQEFTKERIIGRNGKTYYRVTDEYGYRVMAAPPKNRRRAIYQRGPLPDRPRAGARGNLSIPVARRPTKLPANLNTYRPPMPGELPREEIQWPEFASTRRANRRNVRR